MEILLPKGSKYPTSCTRFFHNYFDNQTSFDIKVYEGESHPLKKEVKACPEIHGESGLEGFHYQDIKRAKETKDAISFIIETLLTNKDVILIPTGRLSIKPFGIVIDGKPPKLAIIKFS